MKNENFLIISSSNNNNGSNEKSPNETPVPKVLKNHLATTIKDNFEREVKTLIPKIKSN